MIFADHNKPVNSNWNGQAISLLDNNISDTLTNAGIWNNPITII